MGMDMPTLCSEKQGQSMDASQHSCRNMARLAISGNISEFYFLFLVLFFRVFIF